MRIFGLGLLATIAAAGCGIGDDGNPGPTNGVICNAALTITGTFTQGQARPLDPDTGLPITGCWPDGTWVFTVQIANNMCSSTPTPQASYTFSDHRTDPDGLGLTQDNFTYTADPSWPNFHVKMSADAQGCEGNLEVFNADGTKVWNLVPSVLQINNENTMAGEGDYTEYMTDQWTGSS